MGVKGLLNFVAPVCRRGRVNEVECKTIAVDMSCIIYKSFYTNQSYITLIRRYFNLFLRIGCKIIAVFDGKPWHTKKSILEDRRSAREKNLEKAEVHLQKGDIAEAVRFFRRASVITPEVVEKIIMNIEKIPNVDIVKAPFEADAQLAYLVKTQQADVVVTEDSDLIAYGVCPLILYKLKLTGECLFYEQASLSSLIGGISTAEFRRLCILAGCDYLPRGLKGFGIKKGLVLVQKHQKPLLEAVSGLPAVTPIFLEKFREAEESFICHTVYDPREGLQKMFELENDLIG